MDKEKIEIDCKEDKFSTSEYANVFDNSFINAIEILADKLNLTVDSSKADKLSQINHYIENQIKVIDLILNLCKYTSHIIKIEDNTIKLIDILQVYNSSSITKIFDEFKIIKNSFKIADKNVIKEFKAKWNIKENNNENQHINQEKESIVETGLEVGQSQSVEVFDYIKNNIEYELNKKLSLYNLLDIEFEIMIDEPVEFLEKIEFEDNSFKGSMLVLEIETSEDKKTKTIKGVGNVYNT